MKNDQWVLALHEHDFAGLISARQDFPVIVVQHGGLPYLYFHA